MGGKWSGEQKSNGEHISTCLDGHSSPTTQVPLRGFFSVHANGPQL